jgi:hypothetical protein
VGIVSLATFPPGVALLLAGVICFDFARRHTARYRLQRLADLGDERLVDGERRRAREPGALGIEQLFDPAAQRVDGPLRAGDEPLHDVRAEDLERPSVARAAAGDR